MSDQVTVSTDWPTRSTVTTDLTAEYDRFEALARKLVRVPKEEIERERDAEKARKG